MLAGQGAFFALLAVCVVVRHDTTAQNDGISFYGVYRPTIAILVGAFATGGAALWRAATLFASSVGPVLAMALRAVVVGLGLLLVTPYDAGTFFNWTHMTIGVAMALTQGAVTIALVRRDARPGTWAIFALQLAGGLLAAASLPDWRVDLLLQGEVIYELGFALSILAWLRIVARATS